MLLLLLVDAFRPDYLQKTEFLKYLAASGMTGNFQEPFGFCPRATYFAGLTPGETGYAFTFWRDPDHSPFRASACLPEDSELNPHGRRFVRETLREAAVRETTPFGRSYIHPLNIPLRLAPEFDIAEKYAPWDPRVGYRSLFHELDQEGMRWLYAGWPTINEHRLKRDCEIVFWVLEHVTPEHQFVHVQFCELDLAGHVFGPGSREMVGALAETDRLVRLLMEGLMAIGQPLTTIIFGDHGMINVVRHLDITSALAGLRATAPEDFVYFLDSTVARFWYNNSAAAAEVRAALESFPGGRLLAADDTLRFGLHGLDPRCAHDIFLADPGCLINPNFFHEADNAPVGMHGYDPSECDNQGLFLASGPQFPAGAAAGVVDAGCLYPICRSLLMNPDRPAFASSSKSKQVCLEDERVIRRDLTKIQKCIAGLDPAPSKTVVLGGSFGRDEGAVLSSSGEGRAVNDYDVLVISPTIIDPAVLRQARSVLASDLGLPFVDLSWFGPGWADTRDHSIFQYDLRYGSKIIAGDYAFWDRRPHLAENDIPSSELLRLLCNRAAGSLMALKDGVLDSKPLSDADREFLWIQVMKTGLALADHYVFAWGDTTRATVSGGGGFRFWANLRVCRRTCSPQ